MTEMPAPAATARPVDAFGYPIGTRWIRVDAYDKAGACLGHAVADVLNYPDTAHAQSACFGSLVAAYPTMDDAKITYGD